MYLSRKIVSILLKRKKTVKLNVLNQKVICADQETFARLLLIQQKRKVNLKEILTYMSLGHCLYLYPIMTEA